MSYVYTRKQAAEAITKRPPCWPDGWSYYSWMDNATPPGWGTDSAVTNYPAWWPFPCQHKWIVDPIEPKIPKRRNWVNDTEYGVFIVSPNDRSVISNGVAFSVGVMVLDCDGLHPVTGTVTISLYDGDGTLAFASGSTISLAAASYGTLAGVTYTLSGAATSETITLKASLAVAGQDDVVFFGAISVEKYGFVLTVPANVYRDEAFNVGIQAVTRSTGAAYNYTPSDVVLIEAARADDENDALTPTMTSNADWTTGSKTVSCTITGGDTAGANARIFVVDTDAGISGSADIVIDNVGFAVSAPATIYRGQAFDLAIQGMDDAGANDLTYSPSGSVALSFVDATTEDAVVAESISPTTTSNSGWSSGAKTVSCTPYGGTLDYKIYAVAEDATGGLIGWDLVEVQTIRLAFTVNPAASIKRFVSFPITVEAQDKSGSPVVLTTTTQVSIAFTDSDSDGDTLDVVALTINAGSSSGSATLTLSGGSGTDSGCKLTASATGCTSADSSEFELSSNVLVFTASPEAISRDTAFSMTVQAQDGAGNKIATATDTITITLTSTDAADKFKSPTPDSVSYTVALVDGEWSTTTEQITGGTGHDHLTFTASCSGYVDGTTTSPYIATVDVIGAYQSGFYKGTDVEADGGNEAAAFITTQNDALANLDADTGASIEIALVSGVPTVQWEAHDVTGYTQQSSSMKAGWISFLVSEKANVARVILKLKIWAVADGAFANALDSGALTLKGVLYESTEAGDGTPTSPWTNCGDLRDTATVHLSKTFEEINVLQAAAGGTASSHVLIDLELSASATTWIENMTGTKAFLWLWISGSAVPDRSYANGKGFDATCVTQTTTLLEVYRDA